MNDPMKEIDEVISSIYKEMKDMEKEFEIDYDDLLKDTGFNIDNFKSNLKKTQQKNDKLKNKPNFYELAHSVIEDKKKLAPIVAMVTSFKHEFISFSKVSVLEDNYKFSYNPPKFEVDKIEDIHEKLNSFFIQILEKDEPLFHNKIIILNNIIILKNDNKIRAIEFKNLEYIKFEINTQIFLLKNQYFLIIKFKHNDQEAKRFDFFLNNQFIINNKNIEISFDINSLQKMNSYISNKITNKFTEYHLLQEISNHI